MDKEIRLYPIKLLDKPIEERFNYFVSQVIPHKNLEDAINKTLFDIRSSTGERIVFVCGPSGAGKKVLIEQVMDKLVELAQPKFISNKGCIPVVNVEASAPEERSFDMTLLYLDALKNLNEPMLDKKISYSEEVIISPAGMPIITAKTKKAEYKDVLARALNYRSTSALIINEAHHMLRVATGKKANWLVDVIKTLANRSKTPIVLVGTYELLVFLEDLVRSSTDQVNQRARIVHLPRYHNQVKSDVETFGKTVRLMLRQMPLEESAEKLFFEEKWEYFYRYSLGCIGTLKLWLQDAYLLALDRRDKTITKEHLEETRISGNRCSGMLEAVIDGESKMKRIKSDGNLDSMLKQKDKGTKEKEAEAQTKTKVGNQKPGNHHPKRIPVG